MGVTTPPPPCVGGPKTEQQTERHNVGERSYAPHQMGAGSDVLGVGCHNLELVHAMGRRREQQFSAAL